MIVGPVFIVMVLRIIFDSYPGLDRVPWIELGDFPTPIERLGCGKRKELA